MLVTAVVVDQIRIYQDTVVNAELAMRAVREAATYWLLGGAAHTA